MSAFLAREAWNSLILGISPELVVISILALDLLPDVEAEVPQQDDPTMSWISVGCHDLVDGNVHHQLHGPAKLTFDNLSQWCHGKLLDLLTIRLAKVRAEYDRLGNLFKGILGGLAKQRQCVLCSG